MRTIPIGASSPYNVLVGSGILSQLGTMLNTLSYNNSTKVAVIADSNVAPLYAQTLIDSLKTAGYHALLYTFPAGESSKSLPQMMHLISWLIEHEFTRSDLLVALGGGVTGDLVGFVSAIYLRGSDFIQVPTTFLAAIDSSVGGKTAINIPEGKNLLGSFWQPKLVVCDTNTFATLSPAVFADGVAEAIKYGCIWDKNLFDTLCTTQWMNESLEQVIARCIEIKAEIVEQDERDLGIRQILNFGHTIGHSVEKLSNLEVSHGKAVAIGMCIMLSSQEAAGTVPAGTVEQLKNALSQYDLPTKTSYKANELLTACLSDKKRKGDHINLITLQKIGSYQITPMQISQLEDFIERGL